VNSKDLNEIFGDSFFPLTGTVRPYHRRNFDTGFPVAQE